MLQMKVEVRAYALMDETPEVCVCVCVCVCVFSYQKMPSFMPIAEFYAYCQLAKSWFQQK